MICIGGPFHGLDEDVPMGRTSVCLTRAEANPDYDAFDRSHKSMPSFFYRELYKVMGIHKDSKPVFFLAHADTDPKIVFEKAKEHFFPDAQG